MRENDVQKPSPRSRKRTVKSGGCNGRSEALSQGLSWLSMQPDRRTTSGQMDDFITFFLFFPFSFSPFFSPQIIDRPFFYISPFFLNLVTLAEAWSVKRLGRGWIGRRRLKLTLERAAAGDVEQPVGYVTQSGRHEGNGDARTAGRTTDIAGELGEGTSSWRDFRGRSRQGPGKGSRNVMATGDLMSCRRGRASDTILPNSLKSSWMKREQLDD